MFGSSCSSNLFKKAFADWRSSSDDSPTYVWDENFSIDGFERTIEIYNDNLWRNVRMAICGKLGIPTRMNGCESPLPSFLKVENSEHPVGPALCD